MESSEPKAKEPLVTQETAKPQASGDKEWSLIMPVDEVKSVDGSKAYGTPVHDPTNNYNSHSDEALVDSAEKEK